MLVTEISSTNAETGELSNKTSSRCCNLYQSKYISRRHNNGVNVGYADGHVNWLGHTYLVSLVDGSSSTFQLSLPNPFFWRPSSAYSE